MASNTNKLKVKRASRKKNMGKERKRIIRSKGTTPPFAVHPEKLDTKGPVKADKPAADDSKTKE